MKAVLLDVNVLIALVWPAHEHHNAAHRWFRLRGAARWATCPLTELGLVRITSNPSFSPDALSVSDAVLLLERNLGHSGHQFWPDDLPLASALSGAGSAMKGHGQLTDAYLLALAARRHGTLATFDAGLRSLVPDPRSSALEIVPRS